MKKNFKWLTALAVVGMIIGLVIAYFCKKKNEGSEFEDADFEDEDDFDLDGDLKPVSEREYVPLNKTADQPAVKTEAEEKDGMDPAEEEKSEPEEKETEEKAASDKE